jgi:hypothetical protein
VSRLLAFPAATPEAEAPADPWRAEVAARVRRRAYRRHWSAVLSDALACPLVGLAGILTLTLWTLGLALAARSEWATHVVAVVILVLGSLLVLAAAVVWCEFVPPARPRSAPSSRPDPAEPGRDGDAS